MQVRTLLLKRLKSGSSSKHFRRSVLSYFLSISPMACMINGYPTPKIAAKRANSAVYVLLLKLKSMKSIRCQRTTK